MKIKTLPTYAGNTSLMPIPTCELRNHHHPRGEHFHLRLSYMANVPFLNSSSIFSSTSSLSLSSTFWELSFNLMHPRFSEISILISASFFLSFTQSLGIYIIIVSPFFALHTPKYYYILSVDYPKVSRSLFLLLILIQPLGSLPPTRGTPWCIHTHCTHCRITPAYAGNTPCKLPHLPPIWDHPRLRGEHQHMPRTTPEGKGSPPPTRGTLTSSFIPSYSTRITPAYAGNTAVISIHRYCIQDHPRLRGEHHYILLTILSKQGSPPPTRGTPVWESRSPEGGRITPAYAGNTSDSDSQEEDS